MPARVVVVHDELGFVDQLVAALKLAGHDVAAFADPIVAWEMLAHPRRIEVLVTRLEFPLGRSNGGALAAMVCTNRTETHVLIIGPPRHATEIDGLGTDVEAPVIVPDVVVGRDTLIERGMFASRWLGRGFHRG